MVKNRHEKKETLPFKLIVPLVLCGYIFGILLALLWYEFHPEQRRTDLTDIWYAILCAILVCIILFYSRPIRCIFALAVPSLCSSRGRALLLTIAVFLASIGPLANIIANVEVMLRSISCTQELLRQAMEQMLEVLIEPARAIRTAVQSLLDEVRKVLHQVMVILLAIQEYLLLIIDTLKKCAAWLKSVVDLCNEEVGTPWIRCKQSAMEAMAKCRAKLGIFKALCHATKLFLALCYPAKIIDVFCTEFWDLNSELLDMIMKRYHQFVRHIREMFDASIEFDHDFYFHTNASRNLSDVGEEIIEDIGARLGILLTIFDWMEIIRWFLASLVLLKAIYFYLGYMSSLRYQNLYLTKFFYRVNSHQDKSLLPLKFVERRKYCKITSLRLTRLECLLSMRNAFFLFITSIQLFCICVLDYSLFWLLATISRYGHEQQGLEVPPFIDLEITGGGIVGDIMRGVANSFRPLTQKQVLNNQHCLPIPLEPPYHRYVQIFVLTVLMWIVLLCEPYVLRTRHVIMGWFYPERAYKRAKFLYNQIKTDRVGFIQKARREARAMIYNKDVKINKRLNWCRCCGWILGVGRLNSCILCGKSGISPGRVACKTPECKGLYCDQCFAESKNMCCLCNKPKNYGDIMDISEVENSSDDADQESYGRKLSIHKC